MNHFCPNYNCIPNFEINVWTKNKYFISFHCSKKSKVKTVKKLPCFKWTYGLYGRGYKAATLSKLYQTVTGIIIKSLKSNTYLY